MIRTNVATHRPHLSLFIILLMVVAQVVPSSALVRTWATLSAENPECQRDPKVRDFEGGPVRLGLRLARWQRNSPAQVVSMQGAAAGLHGALVLNTSALPLRSVRLGAYIEGTSRGETASRPFAFIETGDIAVNIPAGETGVLTGLQWKGVRKEPFTLAARSPAKRFDVMVGVVRAAHGPARPPYVHNLPQARRFDTINSALIEKGYAQALRSPRTQEQLKALSGGPVKAVIGPGPQKKSIRCGSVSGRTNCSGEDENCTQTACEEAPAPCKFMGCIVYQDNEVPTENGEWCPFSNMPTFCFDIWWF